ncbi:MAG: sugar ABC transporter permease [Nitrospinota bacterium]|nr:MAG: sugar ABC transporter permease [Nitrospinota bacterium]
MPGKRWTRYWFALPTLVLLFLVFLFPLLYSLYVSFHYLQLGRPMVYVGWENFREALLEDSRFANSVRNNIIIALPTIGFEFLLGFLFALILNQNIRGKAIFTTLLVVPIMISPVMAGMTWRMLYGAKYGAINHILKGIGIADTSFDWFATGPRAILAIVLADVWHMTPFVMMILLAGLQAIPDELYEAARVDGASRRQAFFTITLPLLKLPILVAILMRFIDLSKLFGLIYVLTWGGPGGATETVSFTAYLVGFQYFRIGYASALSYLILIVVGFLSFLLVKLLYTGEENR